MLKDKDLREFRPVYRYMEGKNITLEGIRQEIQSAALRYEIPVAFYNDQIKSGGMINSQITDCIVLYHPEHRNDYFKIAISIRYQGTVAFVAANDFGQSKNMKKLNERQGAASVVKEGWKRSNQIAAEDGFSPGTALGAGLLAGAVKGLKSIGGSKAKQEEENQYYSIIAQILDDIIQ